VILKWSKTILDFYPEFLVVNADATWKYSNDPPKAEKLDYIESAIGINALKRPKTVNRNLVNSMNSEWLDLYDNLSE